MAYNNKFDSKNKRKGNNRTPERNVEYRYAKTNRYSENPSGRTNNKSERPAQSNARYSKPERPAQGNTRYTRAEQADTVEQYPFRKIGERKEQRAQDFRPSFGRKAPMQRQPEQRMLVSPQSAERDETLLFGRNPIREALKSGRDIEKLMVVDADMSGSAREILSMARKAGIRVQVVEKSHLDNLARNHQGMVAFASAYQYATLDDILQSAKDKGEKPFIIILDQITDPHNLGAIIRSAACTGAHGVIIPRHRAV